jgi:two-component system OmpR family sensor kinase
MTPRRWGAGILARRSTSFAVPTADLGPSLIDVSDGAVQEVTEETTDMAALGLAMTAHELRTPLLGARAAVERIRGSRGNPASNLRLLEATEKELGELAERVDQLLRWSVGDRPLRLVGADLAQIVRDAVITCRRERPGREILLTTTRRSPVRADAFHLGGAIQNLIRNSLTYSPAATPVMVTVERRAGSAVVRIRDHGCGIPPEERPTMFQPMRRGSAVGNRRGHGLGLFIAKRIVDAHGGSIAMRTASGGGSCFSITLPGSLAGSSTGSSTGSLAASSAGRRG